jgi:beta-galactosidase
MKALFRILTSFLLLLLCMDGKSQQKKHVFSLGDSVFLLDGKPFQVISGEMHYTRVPREAWRSRFRMARAMGLNTIGTYVFWNVHEPEKGKFDFSGNADIAEFVRMAAEEGLWVILRPSPYVCAEWEFGGYPYWLQNMQGMIVRSTEKTYMQEYRKYILEVGKQLAPLQANKGGNILMVQVENEYGSYGSDKEYLEENRKMFVDAGFDGLLYTCDPAADVARGSLDGLLPGVNGLDKPEEVKAIVRKNHAGKGPFIIAEWYPAWFDWWGTKHHTVPAEKYAGRLDSVLAAGLSINMYMFHGGTTRGFMNGANKNDRKPFEPQISSYDYDAPLDEAGNATHKFMVFREVIRQHLPQSQVLPPVPEKKPVISIDPIMFSTSLSLFDHLPAGRKAPHPLTFEDLGQNYGFVLYRSAISGGKGILKIAGLADFALVFIDGKRVGILDRRLAQDSLELAVAAGSHRLDILVENLGRINFGPNLLKNKKGITGQVKWMEKELNDWMHYSLPFASQPKGTSKKYAGGTAPVIRVGEFSLASTGDTWLDLSNWGKGCVWINGHNLGRYWSIGPQQTIYVPAEWLLKGKNVISILELTKTDQSQLRAIDHPVLDSLGKMVSD